VHAVIAGKVQDDLGANQLRSFTKERKANFSICGWVTAEELGELYASADLLLFPSPVETFGNVTLEGMASGLPCIVDKSSGSHLIDDGVHGILVDSGDVEGFYQAAKKLCAPDAGGLRRRMGAAGRKRAADQYDKERITGQVASHYKQLIYESRVSVQKNSLRWFFIDIFANVVLAIFIVGNFTARLVFIAGFWLIGATLKE